MSSQNRVVIVTGGSTGIGKAIAESFAKENAQVVIIGRRQDILKSAAGTLGTNVSWQQADVSQRSQVATAVTAVVEKFGKSGTPWALPKITRRTLLAAGTLMPIQESSVKSVQGQDH